MTSDGNTLTSTTTIPGSDITGDITGNANNVTGIVTIEHGGTGANTATAAFDALSPTTTTGDIIYYNGNTNVRLGIGAETQVLTVANGVPTWANTSGGGGGTPGGLNTQIQFNDAGTFGGTANLTFDKTTSTFTIGGNTASNTSITGGTVTTATVSSQPNTNLALVPGTNGIVTIAAENGGATGVEMGTPTQGALVSNAVSLTTESTVSNAIAQLNQVLGKLIPSSPPNFPASQTLSINSLSTYRMTNYVQTDNTATGGKSVAGGTTVTNVLRTSSYVTSNITNAGPGDSGTITAWVNGANTGSRTLTTSINGNGTYNNLVIFNNADYSTVNANVTSGFWYIFSARASGTVSQGWNEVYISDSVASNTNIPSWFYDSSSPGTPQLTSTSIVPGSTSLTYSSTVPHYNSSTSFNLQFNVNRLSGNTYPTSDTFATGTAGGAFNAPSSVTYAGASITTPLIPNLYVSSGSVTVNTTATVITGFGSSSSGPSISVNNSYASGSGSFSPGVTVLYKTGTTSTASRIEETNVFVGSTIGVGSGLAFRIINPGSTNTPTFSANAAAFNSQTSTLETYDATVVANVLKHDITNYSTGYLPAGPNLSSGRGGTQYFTFKIIRSSVSKFDIGFSGTVAGMWVALPGSTIDSTSTLNGWIDMSVAYAGAGAPGANIGAGGNGSNGCALGGPVPLNSAQSNKRFTCTFGTVSSSSTATNEIYIRIALTSGQTVTALTLQTASN